jgi:DHA3 family macrolide efflux protein-like MFS transporter
MKHLGNAFIRTILLSGAFLQIGIWVRNFAILLFVLEQTNSDPYAVSLISVAQFAPIFLFSFIGGTFADRWPPRKTMIMSDLLSALSIFLLLLALVFGTWKAVFFATLISSILSQFSQPSAMKLFKVHVPEAQLQAGMAMFQTLMAMFMIIGPILGTFIYQSFGITFGIGVMGGAFLLSAAVLLKLPHDQKEEGKNTPESFWTEFADGFRYVWSKPILRSLGVVFALGGGVIMNLAKKISPQKLLAIGVLASAIGTIGNGLSTTLWAAMLFQFINGFVFPCIHSGINTLILRSSEAAFVGRVNGVLTPLFMGMMVLAMSTAGWLKTLLSIPTLFGTSGLLFLFAVLLLVPVLKHKLGIQKSAWE